jgi:serine phosphatase RsbU (regulator of sigma subunit)
MRVAMILGALRRETSHNPGEILAGLNNALIAQEQLGFTTACCVRISLSGEFTLANAGHIAPYLSGRELDTPPALPLGLIPDQSYELVYGRLTAGERLVLMSDGVPEARTDAGELYGFERLPGLTLMPAQEIADTAQRFGQEDDITVLTLAIASS